MAELIILKTSPDSLTLDTTIFQEGYKIIILNKVTPLYKGKPTEKDRHATIRKNKNELLSEPFEGFTPWFLLTQNIKKEDLEVRAYLKPKDWTS